MAPFCKLIYGTTLVYRDYITQQRTATLLLRLQRTWFLLLCRINFRWLSRTK